jgi:26S proteasome regulatory subunit N2
VCIDGTQIYFHLEQKSEALSFALGAGKLFDLAGKSEFVETIIGSVLSL